MAKTKTNRLARGLAAILAVVVLGGVAALVEHSVRVGHVEIDALPIGQWRCDREPIEIGGCFGAPVIIVGESVGLGPLKVSWPNRLGRAWLQEASGGSSPASR